MTVWTVIFKVTVNCQQTYPPLKSFWDFVRKFWWISDRLLVASAHQNRLYVAAHYFLQKQTFRRATKFLFCPLTTERERRHQKISKTITGGLHPKQRALTAFQGVTNKMAFGAIGKSVCEKCPMLFKFCRVALRTIGFFKIRQNSVTLCDHPKNLVLRKKRNW